MKLKYGLLAALIALTYSGCSDNREENIIHTVTGPIRASQMGMTLIHEHILVDFIGADSTGYHRWNRDDVVDKVLPYLTEIKKYGVKTFIECTPAYLGRDPLLMKKLSEESGINILTNTGFYGAVGGKYIPVYAYDISVDSLANIWIDEFRNGIEVTGIKPGFVKISVDTNDVLSAIDEKIVRAAIKTHKATGMTIVSHTVPNAPAFSQIKIIEEMGISPTAWVWTHAGIGTSEGRLKAAKKGAWISIDNVNKDNLNSIVPMIVELKEAGYLNQLLISHDAGWYDPDDPDGKFNGYTDIFTDLIPALEKNGFTQEEVDQLLIENPKEAYRIRVKKINK